METIEYKGYKINYLPNSFNHPPRKLLEDAISEIEVVKDNKIITLKFIVPFKTRIGANLKTEQVIELALSKIKELIDGNLEKNEFTEFEFMGYQGFEGVIDYTK